MYFDILMPLILFIVTLAAMFLGRRTEAKLKATVEQREFKTRDTILMVALIAVAVSIVVFIPSMAIMALFLFSYSSLLFMVSYAFTDMKPNRLTLYIAIFVAASVVAATAGALGVVSSELRVYSALAFACLATLSFFILVYTRGKQSGKKWFVAALAPVLFLLLFAFYSSTFIWFPYLLDVYGIIFALLIVLYMNSLFTWKTVFIFAAFITALDIVLVWLTGTMVQAAEHISGLGLPVLVAFPTIPTISTADGILIMRLGLGDFFFSGVLTLQTMKRLGKKTAIASLVAICTSFGLFELILLNKQLAAALPVQALPATLPILLGWLPVVGAKMLLSQKRSRRIRLRNLSPPAKSNFFEKFSEIRQGSARYTG